MFPSSSTLNLTTGRSGASVLPQRRFLGASLLDFEALWRVFLATFGILPVLAAPMPSCQLAWRLGVTLMPSPKASAPVWIALFDSHLGIAVADCLAFTPTTSSHNELFWSSRCPSGAITRQILRTHSLSTSSSSQTLGQASWSDCSAFWWLSKNPDSRLTCSVRPFH